MFFFYLCFFCLLCYSFIFYELLAKTFTMGSCDGELFLMFIHRRLEIKTIFCGVHFAFQQNAPTQAQLYNHSWRQHFVLVCLKKYISIIIGHSVYHSKRVSFSQIFFPGYRKSQLSGDDLVCLVHSIRSNLSVSLEDVFHM